MKKTLLLSFAFGFALLGTAALFAADAEEGFVSLFNGKDLTGWSGDARLWSVADGSIVGETNDTDKKITYNNFLVYEKEEFGDFILRFDYRITKAGNSGMQYRAWLNEGKSYSMGGYQGDFDGGATYSGIVYGEGFRGILAERGTASKIGDDHKPTLVERFAENDALKKEVKIEDWNSYEITAQGFSFEHKINGVTMSRLSDEDTQTRRASGWLGIQVHVGPPMKVEVKNIRIKKL